MDLAIVILIDVSHSNFTMAAKILGKVVSALKQVLFTLTRLQ